MVARKHSRLFQNPRNLQMFSSVNDSQYMVVLPDYALAGLYLVQFNVVNNLFNFTLIVQSIDHGNF